MTITTKPNSARGWVGWTLFVLAVGATAFVLRGPLVSWFTGKRMAGAASDAAQPQHGTTVRSKGLSAISGGAPGSEAASAAAADEIDHYTCSMHPSVNQPIPGKCPICGMDLIPVTKAQQTQGVVMIDNARRQLIGVRTERVIEGPLKRTFHAVGHVTYDESSFTDVNLKISGWITKLLVDETGQRVQRGQTLFMLYSPELYTAEQDFLLATRNAHASDTPNVAPSPAGSATRGEAFARAARKRLSLLGLSDTQIDKIATAGEALDTIPITAPASGFVIEKTVVEGASIQASTRLFRIAALDKVWVEADVYEGDLAHVRVGQPATVTLDYLPGRTYEAKLSYVYPYLESAARTGRVRIELKNKSLELRPGMFANVELSAALGTRVQVPASAIVYTGPRRLVFIDLGEGRFKPQEVQLGGEANGMYEVLDGLRPGDRVATSGVFLIAAEARISTAAKYWDDSAPAAQPTAAPMLDRPAQPPENSRQMPMSATKHAQTERRAAPLEAVYSCPMHPEVRSASPGKCPKCGMDLVLVPNGKAQ